MCRNMRTGEIPAQSAYALISPDASAMNPLQNSALYPERDWILTRILWLGGLEPHKNRYGNVDTTWRYIYLHGCPDELMNGQPQSHGCIRLYNTDMVDLFNRVSVGMRVYSHE